MITNGSLSNERNVAAVVERAQQSLGSILHQSGTILYSSSTTIKPGRFYFLGLNPGGSDAGTQTLEQCLANLGSFTNNAYLDEDWSGPRKYGVGRHPLQRNYQHLFTRLGEDLRSVCASNLIFTRSINEKGTGGWKRAELCLSVHEVILGIVCPAAIITFGRQPFDFILSKRSGTASEASPSGHGNWAWRFSLLKTGEKLIGLPHLSRYALGSHPEVVDKFLDIIG